MVDNPVRHVAVGGSVQVVCLMIDDQLNSVNVFFELKGSLELCKTGC